MRTAILVQIVEVMMVELRLNYGSKDGRDKSGGDEGDEGSKGKIGSDGKRGRGSSGLLMVEVM